MYRGRRVLQLAEKEVPSTGGGRLLAPVD